MLNLAILLRRNAGAIAITVVAVLIVAVIAGVALTLSAAAQHSTGAAALRPDTAIACAAGRDLTFDPALDAAAADLWYVESVYGGDFNRMERVAREHNLIPHLKMSMRIPGVVAANLNHADPCIVGGRDLRRILDADDFEGIDAAGVAFFPMPGFENEPVASFMVILLDRDPPSTK